MSDPTLLLCEKCEDTIERCKCRKSGKFVCGCAVCERFIAGCECPPELPKMRPVGVDCVPYAGPIKLDLKLLACVNDDEGKAKFLSQELIPHLESLIILAKEGNFPLTGTCVVHVYFDSKETP